MMPVTNHFESTEDTYLEMCNRSALENGLGNAAKASQISIIT